MQARPWVRSLAGTSDSDNEGYFLWRLILNQLEFLKTLSDTFILLGLSRDGNFAPPLPASPRVGFSHPVKVVRLGWGEIVDPHHGAGRGWV